MPRAAKSAPRPPPGLPAPTFVLDNGGSRIKAGFAPSELRSDEQTLRNCQSIPNALARSRERRTYIGAQIDDPTIQWSDAVVRRPVEHGQLVSWEAEKEIWDLSFFDEQTAQRSVYVRQPEDTTLIVTEAPNTMPSLQKNADEIIMEEWGFGGYSRIVGGYVRSII
jgi:actin-related protein 6